ncbi:hypothetical protein MR829_03740 [Paracoccus versutus]|nr:hypothetical protein [Paracoccus versutus]
MIEAPADPAELFDTLYRMGLTDGMPVIPPTDDMVQRFIAIGPARLGRDRRDPAGQPSGHRDRDRGQRRHGRLPAGIHAGADRGGRGAGRAAVQPVRRCHHHQSGRAADPDQRPGPAAAGPELRAQCAGSGAAGECHHRPGDPADHAQHRRRHPRRGGQGHPGPAGQRHHVPGEPEEESPWVPLHVERGFEPADSTVTVVGVQDIGKMFVCFLQAESILRTLASGMVSFAANNMLPGEGNPILFPDPGHADLLAKQGYDKPRIREDAVPPRHLPGQRTAPGGQRGRAEFAQHHRRQEHGHGQGRGHPDRGGGGPEAYHNSYCATFGNMAVTKKIRLP